MTAKPTTDEWKEKKQQADTLSSQRSQLEAPVLIEVSSQHPLEDGMRPGEEFALRLDEAVKLRDSFKQKGQKVVIFVPGSRHKYKGVADKISLSAAGKQYLVEHGVLSSEIKSEELIAKYKGSEGIYNSADEAFVAAAYFKDELFKELHCVVAPAQLMRKALNYLWNEVAPIFHTVQTADGFHDFLFEAGVSVPYVLNVDPDAQGKDSKLGRMSRDSRVPLE